MKIDIGESLVYSYLRHVKNCTIVQTNWKPSGNWIPESIFFEKAGREFERIQRHPAFVEIFKTGFEHTIKQTEIDVLGLDMEDTVYAVNVAFHEYGINFGAKTDTRNRVIKNLLRAYLTMMIFFPGKKHVLMFCAPKVSPNTEEIINEYFKILHKDFNSQQSQFGYISNELFRDKVLMETLDCIQQEFDTSELFLRSFKLLTIYADETPAEESMSFNIREEKKPVVKKSDPPVSGTVEMLPSVIINDIPENEPVVSETENKEDDKYRIEMLKVLSRIPKWLKHPDQTNSRILITFLTLAEKSEVVTIEQLAGACADVPKFSGNFAQMNNIAEKNHGKVFSIVNGFVTIWEPVREFIIQQYIEFKKSYYRETE
jgi:hypothetical protein